MFPAGAPGVALLVLRNCLAIALAGIVFPAGWQHIGFVALLSLLCIGFLTPAVCVIAAIFVLSNLLTLHVIQSAEPAIIVLSTLSLAVLGPGAFSVDGRLFGRRVVVSSAASSTDKN